MTRANDENLQSLINTVEQLRRERFPHLDADLVQALLQLHAEGVADAEIGRRAEQLVEQRLQSEP